MYSLKVVNSGSKQGNSYALSVDGEHLILDAGVKYKDILRTINYDLTSIKGVLLTHEHTDHIKSCDYFLKLAIPVFSHFGLANRLPGAVCAMEKVRLNIGNFKVVPFYVPHTTRNQETGLVESCGNYAYLVFLPNGEKLLYATDFEYIPVTFKTFKIEHWLIECNHIDEIVDHDTGKYEHVMKGHSSLSTVKDILKTNYHDGIKNVILCHLSESNSHEERMVREIRGVVPCANVFVAEKGLEVSL